MTDATYRPVIFDSVRYPWLRVYLPVPRDEDGMPVEPKGRRRLAAPVIKFANGVYATRNEAEEDILAKKPWIFREDGRGARQCEVCGGSLHSEAALAKHLTGHVQR